MNKTKHTPTPWFTYDDEDGNAIAVSYNKTPFIRGMICKIPVEAGKNAISRENRNANAAHIVKCVNMHEELVEVLDSVLEGIKLGYNLGYLENEVEGVLKKAGAL